MGRYQVIATTEDGQDHILIAKSWPSVCGHLGNMADDYATIRVYREPGRDMILIYNRDGFMDDIAFID